MTFQVLKPKLIMIVLSLSLCGLASGTKDRDSGSDDNVHISKQGIAFALRGHPFLMDKELNLHQTFDLTPLKSAIENMDHIRKQVKVFCKDLRHWTEEGSLSPSMQGKGGSIR